MPGLIRKPTDIEAVLIYLPAGSRKTNKGGIELSIKRGKKSGAIVIICLVLLLAILPLLSACDEYETKTEYEIEIYGGKAGMSSYVAAITLADLINEQSTSLKATAIESPTITTNLKLLVEEPERRPDTLIVSMPDLSEVARVGGEPFSEEYDGLRFIATLGYSATGFVTLDPDIKTVDDFANKTVSIGDKSSATRVDMLTTIMESAGVLDDVTLEYLDMTSGANALRDGLIDATIGALTMVKPGNYTASPYFSELMSIRTVYFVSMDSEDITYMNEVLGPMQVEHVIPAGSISASQTEPWTGLGKVYGWAADTEMPDDVVYEICRIIYENADKFQEYSSALAFVSKDTMANWGLDESYIHPGALEFYEEVGLEVGNF